jgi:protein-S-isoprenylcysteine O-methyltransferase Ste14
MCYKPNVSSVDERHVRAALGVFAALGIALSAGRSLWYWRRHGKRPVAPPRNARERVWQRVFVATIAALVGVCTARLAGPAAYRFCVPLTSLETNVGLAVGLTLIAGGYGLALVAQSQMGASWRIGVPEERTALVTRGLYNRMRNPIYTGLLTAILGLALVVPSLASAAILTSAWLVLRAWIDIEEERQAQLHGEAFSAYVRRTGRFLPRLRRVDE